MTVLVCDDDKEIVEAIDIYLTKEGYNVIKAYDGIEAMEKLKSEEIHLLLMDVMMPRLDGIRATLKIREESSIPTIPLCQSKNVHGSLDFRQILWKDFIFLSIVDNFPLHSTNFQNFIAAPPSSLIVAMNPYRCLNVRAIHDRSFGVEKKVITFGGLNHFTLQRLSLNNVEQDFALFLIVHVHQHGVIRQHTRIFGKYLGLFQRD